MQKIFNSWWKTKSKVLFSYNIKITLFLDNTSARHSTYSLETSLFLFSKNSCISTSSLKQNKKPYYLSHEIIQFIPQFPIRTGGSIPESSPRKITPYLRYRLAHSESLNSETVTPTGGTCVLGLQTSVSVRVRTSFWDFEIQQKQCILATLGRRSVTKRLI